MPRKLGWRSQLAVERNLKQGVIPGKPIEFSPTDQLIKQQAETIERLGVILKSVMIELHNLKNPNQQYVKEENA